MVDLVNETMQLASAALLISSLYKLADPKAIDEALVINGTRFAGKPAIPSRANIHPILLVEKKGDMHYKFTHIQSKITVTIKTIDEEEFKDKFRKLLETIFKYHLNRVNKIAERKL